MRAGKADRMHSPGPSGGKPERVMHSGKEWVSGGEVKAWKPGVYGKEEA